MWERGVGEMPVLLNRACTGSVQSHGPGGGAQGWDGWHCSLADPAGGGSGLFTKDQHPQAVEVTSGRQLGNQRASHGGCPFPAALEPLPPVQPLHLLTFQSHPAPFRHLSSRPPVLRRALGPWPAGTRRAHSFNSGGVSGAPSGASSARGAGWGLRSAVPSGGSSRAASRAGTPAPTGV